MDFIDTLKQFSKRVETIKENIHTEEATKTSMIMPFFQMMGYDVFDPHEFLPEFTADVGIKKGEKVDYAILIEGKPSILIEAKWCGESLDKHGSQLFRYFGTTTAKFGILTNGIVYQFYTDLEEPNKMDIKPFLEINLLDIKDWYDVELKKFHKDVFDIETIFNTASELKYSNEIKNFMAQQLKNPEDDFIKYILSKVYTGKKSQNVIEKFKDVVKKSLNNFVLEKMSDKISLALKTNEATEETAITTLEVNDIEVNKNKIVTTEEELEAFFIVRSILKNSVPTKDKINYKDTENYFGIMYDNNIRKWICRINLDGASKYIVLHTENKPHIKYSIECVEDIYKFAEELKMVITRLGIAVAEEEV